MEVADSRGGKGSTDECFPEPPDHSETDRPGSVQPLADTVAADRRRAAFRLLSISATALAALSWAPILVTGLLVLATFSADAGHGYEFLGLVFALRYTGPVACGLTLIAALLHYRRSRGPGSVVTGIAAAAGLIISVFAWPDGVLPI